MIASPRIWVLYHQHSKPCYVTGMAMRKKEGWRGRPCWHFTTRRWSERFWDYPCYYASSTSTSTGEHQPQHVCWCGYFGRQVSDLTWIVNGLHFGMAGTSATGRSSSRISSWGWSWDLEAYRMGISFGTRVLQLDTSTGRPSPKGREETATCFASMIWMVDIWSYYYTLAFFNLKSQYAYPV